jgi:Tfp pilus assembly protein PilZ
LLIDQTVVTVSETGGSQTVSLTANKAWTASTSQSWCHVSPSAGEEASGSRITISCDANSSFDARNCVVTFVCEERTANVSVSQGPTSGLLLSQLEYNLTNASQQLDIEVKANVKFEVVVDKSCADWVKYSGTKGLTSSTVVLGIAQNEGYDSREGKVTIRQTDGSLSSTVVIRQGQTNGLFITTTDYELSNSKHTLTVEVASNVEFEVKSEAPWIKYVGTKGLKSSQIVLEVDANESYDSRTGKVSVKQINGDLDGIITVKQDKKLGLFLSPTEFDLSNESQVIDVEVQSNVEYEIIIPEDCIGWISSVGSKGLTATSCSFVIAKNDGYNIREGNITFKQKDGPLCGTVVVRQGQGDALIISTPEYSLSNEQHTLTVEVKANVDFEVKSEVGWITVVGTKGLETSQITLNIERNEGYDAREGKVLVKQKDGNLTGTITVRQAEKAGLILSQMEFELDNAEHIVDVEVQSNVEYDIIIPEECAGWISAVGTKGLDTRTCSFVIAKNDGYDAREGSITFKQKDGSLSGTVKITQGQNNGLFVMTPEYSLSNEQHTLTVEVKANVDYEVKSDVDWITVVRTKGLETSQIILNIEKNESYDRREGKVTVSQKNGNLTGTITVRQAEKAGLILSQSEFELDNAEHIVEVEVQSNVEYDIIIPEDCAGWISAIGTKGLSTCTCSFAVAKNEGFDAREGSITFREKGGSLSGTVKITQGQNNGIFVTTSEYSLSNEQHTLTVEVKANVDFDVKSEVDWITVVRTKGLKTSQIVLNVERNERYDPREGKVLVKQKNGNLTGTIRIKQEAAEDPDGLNPGIDNWGNGGNMGGNLE